jgi:hypothetical protein
VSIPFVLSNKNYGLLWDSYSYCRFGNPEEYQQLGKVFKLYDKQGREGCLTGTYTDRNGKTLDVPDHEFSHGMDALRYAVGNSLLDDIFSFD